MNTITLVWLIVLSVVALANLIGLLLLIRYVLLLSHGTDTVRDLVWEHCKTLYQKVRILQDYIGEVSIRLAKSLDGEHAEMVEAVARLRDESNYLSSQFTKEQILNRACRQIVTNWIRNSENLEE